MGGNDIVEFEEDNWERLSEKFMMLPEVNKLWTEFVIDAYNDACCEYEAREDR